MCKLYCSQIIKVSAEKSNKPEIHISIRIDHTNIMLSEKKQAKKKQAADKMMLL
jgi:hypothetical protein